jgi:hypothetical protein
MIGPMSRRAFATLGILAVAGACGSFGNADEPTSGDAGSDAGSDTEARDAVAADASKGCDATFCSAFDEEPYDKGWQVSGTLAAVELEPTDVGPYSLPRSLRSTLDVGSHNGHRFFRRVFDGAYVHARFTFFLRIVEAPDALHQVATIGWGGARPGSPTGDRIAEMQILVDSNNLVPKRDEDGVPDAGEIDDDGDPFAYTTNRWYAVDIDLQYAGREVTAKVSIDGQVVYAKPPSKSIVDAIDFDVGVGVPGAFTILTRRSVVDFDDVRVTIE